MFVMVYHGKDLKGLKFDYFAIQTLNCRYEEMDGEAFHFQKPNITLMEHIEDKGD